MTAIQRALAHIKAHPETREWTSTQIAEAIGINRKTAGECLNSLTDKGHIHKRRTKVAVLYSLSVVDINTPPPVIPRKRTGIVAPNGVLAGERVSFGPSCGIDTRYQIDPATFRGGELMAEWRRLRGKE